MNRSEFVFFFSFHDEGSLLPKKMFSVGDMVVIESRTWPGINKPGGVGKVIALKNKTIDVKYTLGGSEKNIEIIYAKLWDVDLTTSVASTARRGSTTNQACSASMGNTIEKIPNNKRMSPLENKKKMRTEKKSTMKEEDKDTVKKHKVIAGIATKVAEQKSQSEKERSIPPNKENKKIIKGSLKDEKENRLEQKVHTTFKDKDEQPKVLKTIKQKHTASSIRAPSQDESNDAVKSESITDNSKVSSKSSPVCKDETTFSTSNLRDERNQNKVTSLNKLMNPPSKSISRLLPVPLETFIELTSRVMDGAYEMEIERFLQHVNFSGGQKISEEDALKYFELMEDRNIVMFSSSLRTLYRIT